MIINALCPSNKSTFTLSLIKLLAIVILRMFRIVFHVLTQELFNTSVKKKCPINQTGFCFDIIDYY